MEEQLAEFAGTVIVISHDREFLDNVVTETVFLDGTGEVRNMSAVIAIGVDRVALPRRASGAPRPARTNSEVRQQGGALKSTKIEPEAQVKPANKPKPASSS